MIELYRPKIEDLWFRENLMNDKDTMSFNNAWGGTIPFPQEKWENWYNKWLNNSRNKQYYRYVTENDIFLGEIAYYFDEVRKVYMTNVIIHASYRGKGYGKKALLLLCENAKNNGIPEIFDDIAIDNPAIHLFISCGFEEIDRTDKYIMLRKKLSD